MRYGFYPPTRGLTASPEALGVTELIFDVRSESLAQSLGCMERFSPILRRTA